MNPNLMEQFLGPSTQFFRFNSNDINVVATPNDKKTCLITKRNLISKFSNSNSNSSSNLSSSNRLLNSSLSKIQSRYKYTPSTATVTANSNTSSSNVSLVKNESEDENLEDERLDRTIDLDDQNDHEICKFFVFFCCCFIKVNRKYVFLIKVKITLRNFVIHLFFCSKYLNFE